jgi:hypothetical protein
MVVLLGQQTVLLAPTVFFQQLHLRVVVLVARELAATAVLAVVVLQIKVQRAAREHLVKVIMAAHQPLAQLLTAVAVAAAQMQLVAQVLLVLAAMVAMVWLRLFQAHQ